MRGFLGGFSAVAALVSCGKSNPQHKIGFRAASGVSRRRRRLLQTHLPLPGYQLFAPVTLSRFRLTVLLSHLPSSKLTLSHNLASSQKSRAPNLNPPTRPALKPTTEPRSRRPIPSFRIGYFRLSAHRPSTEFPASPPFPAAARRKKSRAPRNHLPVSHSSLFRTVPQPRTPTDPTWSVASA